MRYRQWVIRESDPAAVKNLEQSGISPLVAHTLAARGIADPETALSEYLSADSTRLHDPMRMRDMRPACDRIQSALQNGEKIAVYGDYDVDGITSVCVLVRFLRGEGADCTYYIPDRIEEGYGINAEALSRMKQDGVSLVITVDTGITANAQADYAAEIGLDLVITDHHECTETLPRACAVVNPHRRDCEYPFKSLAGVGVAFKLVCALAGTERLGEMLVRFADLAALGTVADIMPMTEENRVIVSLGLTGAAKPGNKGLCKLISQAGLCDRKLSTASIGYALAPRINAAGRMGCASVAAELLLTDDCEKAAELAARLCALNRERQAVEAALYEEALERIGGAYPEGLPPALVLAGEGWHQGVIGITASKLCEKYGRPVFMLSTQNGEAKGSARSVGGFSLFDALSSCRAMLLTFGGHEQAAGFSLREDRIEDFRAEMCRLAAGVKQKCRTDGILDIDFIPQPQELTVENVRRLSQLEPFGAGNPEPVICLPCAQVLSVCGICSGKHIKLKAMWEGIEIETILFGVGEAGFAFYEGELVDLAGTVEINQYRGRSTLQLVLLDIRCEESARIACDREASLYRCFASGGPLDSEEACCMVPSRDEFVAVWRYIKRSAKRSAYGGPPPEATDSSFREDIRRIACKAAKGAGFRLSYGKTRVCLDVFSDCGLIQCRYDGDCVEITLTERGDKVDLNGSETLRRLKQYSKA